MGMLDVSQSHNIRSINLKFFYIVIYIREKLRKEITNLTLFILQWKCFMIFLPILVFGNFIVLNLFLALLLNSFNTEELKAQRDVCQPISFSNLFQTKIIQNNHLLVASSNSFTC